MNKIKIMKVLFPKNKFDYKKLKELINNYSNVETINLDNLTQIEINSIWKDVFDKNNRDIIFESNDLSKYDSAIINKGIFLK